MEQGIGPLPLRVEGEKIYLLDQRVLPDHIRFFEAHSFEDICIAIQETLVHGATTLGIAAAFAIYLEARKLARDSANNSLLLMSLHIARQRLQKICPKVVHVRWTTDQLYNEAERLVEEDPSIYPLQLAEKLLNMSCDLLAEQIQTNISLSSFGAPLVKDGDTVLIHGNAGSLTTCGWGTAIGIIRSSKLEGTRLKVYVDETRPSNQGSIAVWELAKENIPSTLICDSAAGYLMSQGKISVVIVGADRIALNGDTVNSIGTYALAMLASVHEIPFYVATPTSNFDTRLNDGRAVKIEETKSKRHIESSHESSFTPSTHVLDLPSDITPGKLITAFVTEYGLLYPSYEVSLPKALGLPTLVTKR